MGCIWYSSSSFSIIHSDYPSSFTSNIPGLHSFPGELTHTLVPETFGATRHQAFIRRASPSERRVQKPTNQTNSAGSYLVPNIFFLPLLCNGDPTYFWNSEPLTPRELSFFSLPASHWHKKLKWMGGTHCLTFKGTLSCQLAGVPPTGWKTFLLQSLEVCRWSIHDPQGGPWGQW